MSDPAVHLPSLPDSLGATRASLHVVAARVLGAVRFAAVGRLGLVPTSGGFGTPPFDGGRQVRVDGTDLVDGDRRQALHTVRAAARFVGLDPEAELPAPLALPADLDAPLAPDPAAAAVLAGWYQLGGRLLERLSARASDEDGASPAQLWPEHFDLAIELGPAATRANYGASPGDASLPEPYLYVGPHRRRKGPFWNVAFGAALTYSQIRAGADPFGFLLAGRQAVGDD